jgi:hypothetical protein
MAGWLALALLAAGCQAQPAAEPAPAPVPTAPYACLLPSEQRMLVAELFFGRAIPGRGDLTEVEWARFAADTVTANFPDGFTVFDGEGQWRDPASGRIVRERSKVVLVAAKRSADLSGRLQAVTDAYKARFRQQSVGVVTRDSCAAF